MYASIEDVKKHLIFEEINLKNLKLELEFRKLSNQPIERLETEIKKCQEWYDQLNSMFQKQLGV
jgi:hypothetical protein